MTGLSLACWMCRIVESVSEYTTLVSKDNKETNKSKRAKESKNTKETKEEKRISLENQLQK